MIFINKFWKICAIVIITGGMATVPALANPGEVQQKQPMLQNNPHTQHLSDRFKKMDTNGDGKVVLEEFRASFPNMNENAFAVIDLNGDKAIDQTEWLQFSQGHASGDIPGMRRGSPMNNIPGDPIIPPPDSSDLPLMRPPN